MSWVCIDMRREVNLKEEGRDEDEQRGRILLRIE